MQNKILTKIQKKLNKYFTYFKDDNILVISEEKSVLPFAYLIADERYPNAILISLAVDYPQSINVAEIICLTSTIYRITLTEPFYICTSDGKTYFDEEAYTKWELDTIPLDKIEPLNKNVH
jgi:hypothetical protein